MQIQDWQRKHDQQPDRDTHRDQRPAHRLRDHEAPQSRLLPVAFEALQHRRRLAQPDEPVGLCLERAQDPQDCRGKHLAQAALDVAVELPQ